MANQCAFTINKVLPQDMKSFPRVTKSCFDANVQAISLSGIPKIYSSHPTTSIPFKFTYACRLLVTTRGFMFPISLHVQLLHCYGYHSSNCNGYFSYFLSYLANDFQR